MKTSHYLFAAALAFPALFTGCAVSPDYSHYDWHARGGIVEEQDRSLAAARFEPFQNRRRSTDADEPLTPPGAPTARSQEVLIDPDPGPTVIAQGPTRTVATRTRVSP